MRNERQIDSAAAKIARHSMADSLKFRRLIDQGNSASVEAWSLWREAWDVFHDYYAPTRSKRKDSKPPADNSDLI